MNRKQLRKAKKQKKNTYDQQYKASIIDCSQTFVLKMELPKKTLVNLQAYSRDLLEASSTSNMSANLVGQIESGKELKVDPTDPKVEDFELKVRSLAVSYIKEFQSKIRSRAPNFTFTTDIEKGLDVQSDSIWLNSYKKGDYNPYHDHGTRSPTGLSWFLYIKIPEGMNDYNMSNDDRNRKRIKNGCTSLHWGYDYHDTGSEILSLIVPPNMLINPREGDLYIFPKWLKHQVYPHACDGERITMAGNISVFTPSP